MTESSRQTIEHLQDLPDPELPDSLWQRVDTGRRLKMQRRRLGLGTVTLMLLTLLSAPLLAPMLGGMRDATPAVPQVVHEPLRSEQDLEAELRALDHALQVAYNRGASDAEIAPMWAARDALLASATIKPKTNQT